ncbi:MAG: radical SAM protein [Deltaproteobacteria bacterium]|nr:radical SAM protein [Deltaproteobacteria bacterium]
MRVLLISANTEPINMPIIPVGLGAVAAATRDAGHEVNLVDLMNVSDTRSVVKDAIATFYPDVIGISVRNIDDQNIRKPQFLLDQVKTVISDCRGLTDDPIVLGGAGYSVFPETSLAYLGADMGIQGEGEVAFPLLLDRMERGADLSGVPGLYVAGVGLQGKRQFKKNLDLLPLPDADLWTPPSADENDLYMPVQTRRGCPMNCSYCSTSCIEGSIIRKRSPEVVVDALARLVEKGFRRFFFADNIFNIPPTYARELCRAIADRDLDIIGRCIIYPGKIDEALVKEMARAGCREVALGFESGSERILKLLNKKFTPEDVRRTCDMLADHGIFQMGFLLLGGPGETKTSVEESIAFADSLPVNVMKITPGIRIYPFTSLAKQALSEGVITPDDDLLFPKFYMVEELEDWLLETASKCMAERPNWVA